MSKKLLDPDQRVKNSVNTSPGILKVWNGIQVPKSLRIRIQVSKKILDPDSSVKRESRHESRYPKRCGMGSKCLKNLRIWIQVSKKFLDPDPGVKKFLGPDPRVKKSVNPNPSILNGLEWDPRVEKVLGIGSKF